MSLLSALLAWEACPTMMIGSKTSCRKVWATQETITKTFPDMIAIGRETSESMAKAIAAHIVPTAWVIFSPAASSLELIVFRSDFDWLMSEL